MNSFVRQHRASIRFGYCCFDRIVCNLQIPRLQYAPCVADFLLHRRRAGVVTPQYFKRISEQYHEWLQQRTQASRIPIVEPPRDRKLRREEWVQPYFKELGAGAGVAVILRCREPARVAVSYPSRKYLIELTTRFPDVYYFYVQHPQYGQMFLRLPPYFPFNAQVCLNGHEWLARRLQQEGIAFVKSDNAILDCADPQRLQELADTFAPEPLQASMEKLLDDWLPYFSADERAQGYRHRLYVNQVEYCDNFIFHRHAALQRLFERLLDLNRSIGQPKKLAVVFGRRRFQADTRTAATTIKITPLGTTVISSGFNNTSVKQYVKDKVLLRTETTCNHLRDLSLRKDIRHVPRLRQVFAQSNDRYLNAQQAVLASYLDRGQLQQLRQPTVSPSGRRTPGLRLDDVRLVAVWQAITCFIHLVGRGEFRTKDLLDKVQRTLDRPDYQLSQLRYDLGKLRGKGLVQRVANTQHYQLTREGYCIGVLYCKLYHRLYAPMIAGLLHPVPADNLVLRHRLARLDRLYAGLDKALHKLTDYLAIRDSA